VKLAAVASHDPYVISWIYYWNSKTSW